jgi:hypothetical protein
MAYSPNFMQDDDYTLTEKETAEAAAVSNTYTLTADEKAQVEAIAAEIRNLQNEAGAVIRSIARVRGLNGNWVFNQNDYTFTKQA